MDYKFPLLLHLAQKEVLQILKSFTKLFPVESVSILMK
jgi:hypothetical protein